MKGNSEIVRHVLKSGVNVNATNRVGGTDLQHAAYNKHTESVKLLLEAGANVDARDNYSRTALQQAALWGCEACVRLLLDAGADINATGKDGSSAFQGAFHILAEQALQTDRDRYRKIVRILKRWPLQVAQARQRTKDLNLK